jgi:UDP-N-acetylglucosamine--N-acetylmuramyl-(pentapeptide) pyrophosphoryl-undecaprenol N-acetylglucosamine transferase
VIGLGGYASGPGGLAARLLGIPLVIHEQNAVAGTTNKILARFAKRVLQAFPGAFPEATAEVVGNPVRAEIVALPTPAERQVGAHRPLRLLVLGGSLGALAINKLVPEALGLLAAQNKPAFEVRHQCGRKHVDVTTTAYQDAGVNASVEPFIADMAAAYGWADFIVCRAGALTVSELAAAGVAALLIPFPAAIDDHQTKNAAWLGPVARPN